MELWIKALLLLPAIAAISAPIWIPMWYAPYCQKKEAEKARRELAATGLTVEQYMATFHPDDLRGIAKARVKLGLHLNEKAG